MYEIAVMLAMILHWPISLICYAVGVTMFFKAIFDHINGGRKNKIPAIIIVSLMIMIYFILGGVWNYYCSLHPSGVFANFP